MSSTFPWLGSAAHSIQAPGLLDNFASSGSFSYSPHHHHLYPSSSIITPVSSILSNDLGGENGYANHHSANGSIQYQQLPQQQQQFQSINQSSNQYNYLK
jgi:hypothetical protein